MTSPCTISNMSRLLPGDDGFYCGRYALGEFAVLFGVGIGVGLAEHSFGWGLAASDADVRGYRSHAAASGRSRSQVDRAGAPCDITRTRASDAPSAVPSQSEGDGLASDLTHAQTRGDGDPERVTVRPQNPVAAVHHWQPSRRGSCEPASSLRLRHTPLVGGTQRSRTAQGVAAERALLTDMGVLADPFARRMLTPSMVAIVNVVQHLPTKVLARSVTLAGLAARLLWFDAQVTEALDADIKQIAVIGAGYDSRAWRFRREGVRFFELDHGATQQEKKRRAPSPAPIYVAADLTTQSAGETLVEHGLDTSLPVLFVVEGVTMYLDEKIVRDQLGGLGKSSAVGSRLAVDFYPPRDTGTSLNHRQNRLQHLARLGSGETLRLTIDRSEAVELVAGSGWDAIEETSLREAARSLVPSESGLPVNAVNEHKTLVAGLRL